MNPPITPDEALCFLIMGACLVFALIFIIVRALGGHTEGWRTTEEVRDLYFPYLKKEEEEDE